MNLYNDNDPKACAWLRELIRAGAIPPGVVDERSITEIKPEELDGYEQCHFFAGIGGWPLALQLAGMGARRSVFSLSCPCQPFSHAGKQMGRKDPRHLWPAARRHINRHRPSIIFGEQVASKDGRLWLAGVQANLETMGYATAAADLCAAGVGAPHIRQRLYWVAFSHGQHGDRGGFGAGNDGGQLRRENTLFRGETCGLGDSNGAGCFPWKSGAPADGYRSAAESDGGAGRMGDADGGRFKTGKPTAPAARYENSADSACSTGRMGDSLCEGLEGFSGAGNHGNESRWNGAAEAGSTAKAGEPGRMEHAGGRRCEDEVQQCRDGSEAFGEWQAVLAGGGGAWGDFDILHCLDGKARRIESGTFPLADGVPARVGRLRGYGNAIVPPLAAEFILAAFEAMEGMAA